VERSRLVVDTLKWYASKMRPERYGERVAVTGVKGGAPIVTSQVTDTSEAMAAAEAAVAKAKERARLGEG
jgi:hypothetical protein